MINNYQLLEYLNNILEPDKYQDYCPNGLQVQGVGTIKRIITGVSISEHLIDIAIKKDAQAIIVHHGMFWFKDDYSITGIKRNRLAKLLDNGINLYAYHLPLDNHPIIGNNIQLAKLLNIKVNSQTGKQNLLWVGELRKIRLSKLLSDINNKLQRNPNFFSHSSDPLIKSVAWCTGGADSFFSQAIELGVDAFITGEVSEPMMSLAHESKVTFIAAGHYATERYGIQALTHHLINQLNFDASFIELYNPI